MVCCVRKGHSECHRVYFPGQKEVKSVGKRYWMEILWERERGTEVSWAGPKTHQGLFVKLETTAVTSVCLLLTECLRKILKFCKTNSVSEFKNTHLNKLFENSREKNMSAENLLCLKTNLAASADCGILCKYVYASPSEENVQEWDTVTKPGTLTLVQGHLAYLLLPQQSPLVLRPHPQHTHTHAHTNR